MQISIINGPNLNLLGSREKDIYGDKSFDEYLKHLRGLYPDIVFNYFQSNIEGEIINALHEASDSSNGVILNAGGFTHTSVSVADAVASVNIPVIEVHISNILAREEFRHNSIIAPYAAGSIFGFGIDGYRLATEALLNKLNE